MFIGFMGSGDLMFLDVDTREFVAVEICCY